MPLTESPPSRSVRRRMRLFSGPLSMFGAKTQIAAIEKGLDFELVMVAFENAVGYQPKHPEVVRVNPKQQVPILLDGNVEIFDSTQIFEYFETLAPEPPLWPHEICARAMARRLEMESDEVYFPPIIRLMGLQSAPDDPVAIAARKSAADYYARMEGVLAANEFLAGAYSYADIAFYMAQVFGERMGAPMTAETPRLMHWRERMTQRASVRCVVGAMVAYLRAAQRPVPDFLRALEPPV
jgi:glutathione S-transferase